LTSHLERTIVSEKMIDDDLSWVEESATKSIYKLSVAFERHENNGEKRAPKFIPTSNYYKEEEIIKSTKTHYPSSLKSSFNPKREVRKETPKPREEAFVYIFMAVLITWMSFTSVAKELRRDALTMLETHIVISSLIFRLVLTLILRLALLLVPCLVSLMDLTIAHMILVHERTNLCLDALVTAHVLIVVIISRVGLVFLLRVSHSL
jgi:hypothetical protein